MIFNPVVNTLRYDASRRINCGACLAVCPQGCFTAGEKTVKLSNPSGCMECGACQNNCSVGAILVESGTGCAEAMIRAAIRGHKQMEPEACT